MKKAKTWNNVRTARRLAGVKQCDFWEKFGITQSGGSRYENGRSMPAPLRILTQLYISGKITDADLAEIKEDLGDD